MRSRPKTFSAAKICRHESTPQFARRVFGSKRIVYNDYVATVNPKLQKLFGYFSELLAVGQGRIYCVSMPLGVFHAHNNSAVFVAGEVDLQGLGAAHPRNIGLVATLNVGAGDHNARNHRTRNSPTKAEPPAFFERLGSDDVFGGDAQTAVQPPKLLSGAEFDSQLAGVDVNGWHGSSLLRSTALLFFAWGTLQKNQPPTSFSALFRKRC